MTNPMELQLLKNSAVVLLLLMNTRDFRKSLKRLTKKTWLNSPIRRKNKPKRNKKKKLLKKKRKQRMIKRKNLKPKKRTINRKKKKTEFVP